MMSGMFSINQRTSPERGKAFCCILLEKPRSWQLDEGWSRGYWDNQKRSLFLFPAS
jgi:hypothetical protein